MTPLSAMDYITSRSVYLGNAVDHVPHLKGAGLLVVDGTARRQIRPSTHASRLPTYIIIELGRKTNTAPDSAVDLAFKKIIDSMFTVGGGSTTDAAREMNEFMFEPVRSFVTRDDFGDKILPKFFGVGLGTAALVLGIPAFLGAATVGPLAMLITGVGLAAGAVSLSASVGNLYYQITDSKLAGIWDDSPEWGRFQATWELIGIGAGVGGGVVQAAKDGLIKSLNAAKASGRVQNLKLDEIVGKIRTMPDEQFEELIAALRQSKAFSKAVPGSKVTVESIRNIRNNPRARLGRLKNAFAVQAHWASELRAALQKAIVADSKTIGKNFLTDKGTAVGSFASAMPATVTGSGSGLLNATWKQVANSVYYVIQLQSENAGPAKKHPEGARWS